MKIVITGSNGFLGKNLLNELPQLLPNAEISTLVRSKTNREQDYAVDYHNINTLLTCRALQDADYVIHAAGVTKGITKDNFWDGNVIPTRNLLEAIVETNKNLKRFIYISSHTAAGPSKRNDHCKEENEETEPVEYYGESKLAAEWTVKSYKHVVPYTILRPGAVYGPYDVDFLNIFKMTRYHLNVYPGYKHHYVSYIYVSDLVRAISSALQSDAAINQTYFICNTLPVTWQEIHEEVFRTASSPMLSVTIPFPVLKGLASINTLFAHFNHQPPLLNPQKIKLSKQPYWIASNRKAREELGFSPAYTLEYGLRLTYDWYQKQKLI